MANSTTVLGKRKSDSEPLFGRPPPGYVAGVGRGMIIGSVEGAGLDGGGRRERIFGVQNKNNPVIDDDMKDYSEAQFDEFSGYSGSLFAGGRYEQDDREADDVWNMIDDRMESRRRGHRERREQEELNKIRKERPKIQATFSDLKNELGTVSLDEWEAIPDIGDNSLRFKQKEQRFTPAPDSLLEKARQENEKFSSIDSRQQKYGGLQTPAPGGMMTPGPGGMATPMTDLNQVGEARKTVLNLKLKEAGDSVSGQTNVDPKGYLTDLNSLKINSEAEIGDIKKARLLLKSVITTNPKHPPGWIAFARLEELAGKLVAARRLIDQGCKNCPSSEDVWLEGARLHTPENAKALLASAVRHNPESVRLWLKAAELETETPKKRRVLRKALEHVPNSVRLWKAAVQLESPEDARVLLARAVECVPHAVDMWLALARLETYKNARKVLNEARKKLPTEPQIWITAAKLEEANGNAPGIDMIIKRAVRSLAQNAVTMEREQWLSEAEAAEKSGSIRTAQVIVRETIGLGVEQEDRKRTWLEDAEACLARGSTECARAIYAHALATFPSKKSLWLRAAELEKRHASNDELPTPLPLAEAGADDKKRSTLDRLLETAVSHCPHAEVLWLMWAKDRAVKEDIDGARQVLQKAFAQNPNSEHIWLAAVKLERDNNEVARARSLLQRARERAGTPRVWLKSAVLERDLGKDDDQRALLDEALRRYPQDPKLWMMRAQLAERAARSDVKGGETIEDARRYFERGLRNNPTSIPLWLCLARLELKAENYAKARAVLEKARLKNPKTSELWKEAVRVELAADKPKIADSLLSKSMQECPTAGDLWALAIELAPRAQQKARSVDALKRCDNDARVVLAVARIFWHERRIDKARTWLNRAVHLDPTNGDAWATLYKFEAQHGEPDTLEQLTKRCNDAEPHYGEKWIAVSKAPENFALNTEQILKRVALTV